MARTLRLAVAQSTVPEDPTDRGALRAAGQEIRALMAEADGLYDDHRVTGDPRSDIHTAF
ncbi:hypothetical protein ABZ281_16180 [Streptomyces sp. NPDC006265]|uniref:hypothetical protein n=1 Tax=Streptomyces sp. NPDC006265 TaxID=3156740 RepID=UPI0033B604F7